MAEAGLCLGPVLVISQLWTTGKRLDRTDLSDLQDGQVSPESGESGES